MLENLSLRVKQCCVDRGWSSWGIHDSSSGRTFQTEEGHWGRIDRVPLVTPGDGLCGVFPPLKDCEFEFVEFRNGRRIRFSKLSSAEREALVHELEETPPTDDEQR